MLEVEFYETEDGGCPVQEFLDELKTNNSKLYVKTLRTIDLLEEYGAALGMPHSKYVGDDIFELRTKQGSNITRVLYFFVVGDKAILTNGIVKKTNKLPAQTKKTALIHMADYKRRYDNEKL